MSSKAPFQLLIFDFDGTIADTSNGIVHTVNSFLKMHNKPPLTDEKIKAHIGLGLSQLLEGIFSELDSSFLKNPELYNDFIELYEKNYLTQLQPFPGIREFLDQWPHKIAIVSNKFEQFLQPSLQHMKLEHHNWLKIIGRDTLEEHKPHPLPLMTCMDAAKVSPSETLMIGDGLPDIHAAKAAGVKSIAVEFGYAPLHALNEAGADYTLPHFDQLSELINSIKS